MLSNFLKNSLSDLFEKKYKTEDKLNEIENPTTSKINLNFPALFQKELGTKNPEFVEVLSINDLYVVFVNYGNYGAILLFYSDWSFIKTIKEVEEEGKKLKLPYILAAETNSQNQILILSQGRGDTGTRETSPIYLNLLNDFLYDLGINEYFILKSIQVFTSLKPFNYDNFKLIKDRFPADSKFINLLYVRNNIDTLPITNMRDYTSSFEFIRIEEKSNELIIKEEIYKVSTDNFKPYANDFKREYWDKTDLIVDSNGEQLSVKFAVKQERDKPIKTHFLDFKFLETENLISLTDKTFEEFKTATSPFYDYKGLNLSSTPSSVSNIQATIDGKSVNSCFFPKPSEYVPYRWCRQNRPPFGGGSLTYDYKMSVSWANSCSPSIAYSGGGYGTCDRFTNNIYLGFSGIKDLEQKTIQYFYYINLIFGGDDEEDTGKTIVNEIENVEDILDYVFVENDFYVNDKYGNFKIIEGSELKMLLPDFLLQNERFLKVANSVITRQQPRIGIKTDSNYFKIFQTIRDDEFSKIMIAKRENNLLIIHDLDITKTIITKTIIKYNNQNLNSGSYIFKPYNNYKYNILPNRILINENYDGDIPTIPTSQNFISLTSKVEQYQSNNTTLNRWFVRSLSNNVLFDFTKVVKKDRLEAIDLNINLKIGAVDDSNNLKVEKTPFSYSVAKAMSQKNILDNLHNLAISKFRVFKNDIDFKEFEIVPENLERENDYLYFKASIVALNSSIKRIVLYNKIENEIANYEITLDQNKILNLKLKIETKEK